MLKPTVRSVNIIKYDKRCWLLFVSSSSSDVLGKESQSRYDPALLC